jgi:hypothetical protein
MNKYFVATIQWKDGEICEGYIFKCGDIDDDKDNNVFFYIDNESDMYILMEEGVEDFTVLKYE